MNVIRFVSGIALLILWTAPLITLTDNHAAGAAQSITNRATTDSNQQLAELLRARHDLGMVPPSDKELARYSRLDAEIAVLKAKR